MAEVQSTQRRSKTQTGKSPPRSHCGLPTGCSTSPRGAASGQWSLWGKSHLVGTSGRPSVPPPPGTSLSDTARMQPLHRAKMCPRGTGSPGCCQGGKRVQQSNRGTALSAPASLPHPQYPQGTRPPMESRGDSRSPSGTPRPRRWRVGSGGRQGTAQSTEGQTAGQPTCRRPFPANRHRGCRLRSSWRRRRAARHCWRHRATVQAVRAACS
mmetsp:Transcript_54592/g.162248  ORF Transcript_54592/g.162248 Transcript_54592/m.162248 type:complete len:211 (+) Transcript_54592:420-1052(+)